MAIPSPLASCDWFAALDPAERARIEDVVVEHKLGTDQPLFLQGEAGGDFYLLVRGTIKISSVQENGKEAILGMMEEGNWFGEIALLDNLPRSHSAHALSPCELLVVPRAVFDELMRSATFARAIAVKLAGRVRGLCCLVEDATLLSTRARIASRLLLLAHGDATLAADARSTANISQDALAMMLGITRQTLNKELQAMAAAGAVNLGYGRIDIASLPNLKAIAGKS